jgi:pimeloyl-ACP methyl ester carboxylesterase
MIELLVFLAGLSLGGGLAWLCLSAAPDYLPLEVRIALSVVGAMLGAAVAYGALYVKRNLIARADASAEPTGLPPPRPQVVGSLCAGCRQRIVFIAEGHFCPRCDQIFCNQCEAGTVCAACREVVDAQVVEERRP